MNSVVIRNHAILNEVMPFIYLTFLLSQAQASNNQELWDLYPSAIGFAQFDGDDEVLAADIVSWDNYELGNLALEGQTFQLQISDGTAEAIWTPTEGSPIMLMASSDWNWHILFDATFVAGNCTFEFDQSLGVRMLEGEEGYRLAQREQLAWSGQPGTCAGQVRRYMQSTANEPIMPAHLSDWQSLGGPVLPTETGRFEIRLWHEVRRTRRLLPFELTADADADPLIAQLGAIASAQARYTLILARLGPLIFSDRFELGALSR